jgi:hypothetical protein
MQFYNRFFMGRPLKKNQDYPEEKKKYSSGLKDESGLY